MSPTPGPLGGRGSAPGGRVEDGKLHRGRDRHQARLHAAHGPAQAADDPAALGGRGPPMSTKINPNHLRLSPAALRHLNEVCDRFEAVWTTGSQPRIEDY